MAEKPKGEYKLTKSGFSDKITADGSSGFKAEAGRYHLYVSLACPFAHRAIIARKLKGLEDAITMDVVHWRIATDGWYFDETEPGCTVDTLYGKKKLREIYQMAEPDFNDRITVPVLWDKQTKTIVNNESSEILHMFLTECNEIGSTEEKRKLDLYPADLQKQIDSLNDWIYPEVNIAVYHAGFATSQEAYDEGVTKLFKGLDKLEAILDKQRYLTGGRFTEADIRLFTSLLRFDPVYVQHFKCNKKMIKDYPNLWGYLRDVLHVDGIKDTVNFTHITHNYEKSHPKINPFGIIPIGPDLDYELPHGREALA